MPKVPKYTPDNVLEQLLQLFSIHMQQNHKKMQDREAVGGKITQRDVDASLNAAITNVAAAYGQARDDLRMVPFTHMENEDACMELARALCKGFNAGMNLGMQQAVALQQQAEEEQDRRIILPN